MPQQRLRDPRPGKDTGGQPRVSEGRGPAGRRTSGIATGRPRRDDRPLRQAYQNLINQAEASGKAREAAEYRDNLAILEQVPARPSVNAASPNPAHAPDPSPALPASAATDPRPQPADSLPIPRSSASPDQQPFKEPSSLPDPPPYRPSRDPVRPAPILIRSSRHRRRSRLAAFQLCRPGGIREIGDATTPAKAAEEPHSRPEHDGETPAGSTQPSSRIQNWSRRIDGSRTRNTSKPGQAYARLAAQNQLPVRRKQVWAYCRWVAVEQYAERVEGIYMLAYCSTRIQ